MPTDYRSVESLEVRRSGEAVGTLARTPKGCKFTYSEAFLSSNQPPVAYHLPKTKEGITVEGHVNLPTYFSGLIPEGVMGEAVVRFLRTSQDDLFSVLAATGSDAIGDVTVHVPGDSERHKLSLSDAQEQ
ncbi:MAG: HipA N-terminal domain-containing protein, partial [bacterium]